MERLPVEILHDIVILADDLDWRVGVSEGIGWGRESKELGCDNPLMVKNRRPKRTASAVLQLSHRCRGLVNGWTLCWLICLWIFPMGFLKEHFELLSTLLEGSQLCDIDLWFIFTPDAKMINAIFDIITGYAV